MKNCKIAEYNANVIKNEIDFSKKGVKYWEESSIMSLIEYNRLDLGIGYLTPEVSNKTKDGTAKNRRVELVEM